MILSELSDVRARLLSAKDNQTFAEPALYYALQRAAIAHMSSANAVQQAACAALETLGERLGKKFDEMDCIDASKAEEWTEAIDRLVALIDLSVGDESAGSVAMQVANHRAFVIRLL